jgi:cytoskeletal protein CcmA (bactofilin family)
MTFDSKNSDTVIGHEAYFQGTLTAKGSLRVDGRIDGSIVDAKLVTIGKSGKIKGDVSCEICSVSGDIAGNVAALECIEVLSGAKLTGDLRAPKIIIEEGAVFNGNCSMTGLKGSKTENSEKAAK